MSEINTWPDPGWRCVREIGKGGFGKVFEIEKKDNYGKIYRSALKVVSIPKQESDISDAYSEGMNQDEVTQYFQSIVRNVTDECALMSELKGNTNIVSFEDHMVVPHDDGIGADILIKMELLTPVLAFQRKNGLSLYDVAKIGVDICRALELCQRRNILHRDIKPENIFVNLDENYKLGDFGIARISESTISAMSRKGTYTYMAPEVYRGEAYGASADIYSLGMVLYKFLNKNRMPFLPAEGKFEYEEVNNAVSRRMQGDAVPEPQNGSQGLKNAICKALEAEPGKRYKSAEEFRRNLEACDEFKNKEKYSSKITLVDSNEYTGRKITALSDDQYDKTEIYTEGSPLDETLTCVFPQDVIKAAQESNKDNKEKGSAKAKKINVSKLLIIAAVIIALFSIVIYGSSMKESADARETVKEPETYSISYELNGGTMADTAQYTTSYTADSKDIAVPVPERAGYEFAGWFTDADDPEGSMVNGNVLTAGEGGDKTLFAKWTPEEYTITYYGLEGAVVMAENPTNYNIESADVILYSPTKDGYEFAGWFPSNEYLDTQRVNGPAITAGSTGDRSFYAKWNEIPKPAAAAAPAESKPASDVKSTSKGSSGSAGSSNSSSKNSSGGTTKKSPAPAKKAPSSSGSGSQKKDTGSSSGSGTQYQPIFTDTVE